MENFSKLQTKIRFKTIRSGGNSFIKRMSVYFKKGSLKVHLFLDDDKDEPHSHPWNFTSLILFGGYDEYVETDNKDLAVKSYGFLSRNKKQYFQKHKVKLKRIFGIKIPCLTIGWYSQKKQLCSFCAELGYCKESKPTTRPT